MDYPVINKIACNECGKGMDFKDMRVVSDGELVCKKCFEELTGTRNEKTRFAPNKARRCASESY